MMANASDPLDIVKEKGWLRITDKVQLKSLCDELINKSSEKVSI
jgi:aspartyl-tRNA(Asn)/glutamyl-tRNA(Gln) amidotransferase subunit B